MPRRTRPAAPDGTHGPDAPAEVPNARDRLVDEALRLFAHQGYARTSVRQIADAAQVNIAAIRYYFGDKAGLYRAAFFEPMDGPPGTGDPESALPGATGASGAFGASGASGAPTTPAASGPPVSALPVVLQALFDGLLAPLREGERAGLCMRLHFREMLEPTGLWDELIDREIRPMHEALMHALQAHLALAEPDDDLRRLAVSIAGLGVHLHVGAEVIASIAPSVAVQGAAVDAWRPPLVDYALAMVAAEAHRRRTGTHSSPPPDTPGTLHDPTRDTAPDTATRPTHPPPPEPAIGPPSGAPVEAFFERRAAPSQTPSQAPSTALPHPAST